jgi:hypothetical protein
MIEAVLSCHSGLGNARRSLFPTWNETAGIQVLIACVITHAVYDVTNRKWRLRSRERFLCCSLLCMNRLFLFSGPSGDNFRVIRHLPTALGVGFSCFRQRGAFVKGNKWRTSACVRRKCGTSETVFSSQSEEVCAPFESWIGDVDYDCVEGVAEETGNEALSSSLGAVSSFMLRQGVHLR